MTVVYLLAGTTSWTVPNDWNSTNNSIKTIGGGGGGQTNTGNTAHNVGGGGGAYSAEPNITLTPGNNITVAVGTGGAANVDGGETYFNGASLAASSVGSKGGTNGASGGAGGLASAGIGTTKFSGGAGGVNTGSASFGGGTGGGGAAGPNGDGKNGGTVTSSNFAGSGGGAGSGGADGVTGGTTVGGNGGAAFDSTAGGIGGSAANGGPGSHGSGGGGGSIDIGGVGKTGGAGGAGIEFDATHGAGGGAGGGGDIGGGGPGGLYGGGGGANGAGGGAGGAGANGLIIITYEPVSLWGFQPTTPEGLRTWFNRAGGVMPGANVAAPLFGFLPAGWQQTGGWTPPAFRRYPPPSTVIAALGPAPAPVGWGFSPNNPQPPRRSWERTAGSLQSPLNIESPLFNFLPGGWEMQSPPPPRRRWERADGILPAAINLDAELFSFLPYGWAPILPVVPAFRRKFAAQELTWQEPFIFNFVVVPLEWGFEPILSIAQRDWFNRAGGIMPSANVEAPFSRFLPAGWAVQPPQPPRRRWERSASSLPVSLNIPEPFVFVPAAPAALEWGFVLSPAYLPRRRWERLAAALPAAFNIAAPYVFVASSQRPQILVIIG